MEEGRVKKATRNIAFSFIYKFFDVILAFVLRTVFIQTLGTEYLGLSGLFTGILNVLSLLELGVGPAIAFLLYKPLAEHDNEKVAALMQLYRRVYAIIGIVVCGVGLALTPFLGKIINLPNNIDNLIVIYWLSVANTAVSYFLAYHRTVLTADQRSDICSKIDIIFRIIRCAGLIGILFLTHNYIAYLSFEVCITLASNIVVTVIVNKKYSYINRIPHAVLDKEEKSKIVKYMSSTIFTKFGQTIVTSTDSILISAFISTGILGLYSNYNMIYSNLDIIIYLIFSSITASVGNYAVFKNNDNSYALFKKLNMANYMIVCAVSVCLFCLASPFVSLWIGTEYCLSEFTVGVIVLNFYITANQNSVANFMSAKGEMHYKNRYRALIEGIVNIVFSIVLVKYTPLGITGVFIGTTVCFISGRMWMDATVLFKNWFGRPLKSYFFPYLFRFLLFVLICVVMKLLSVFIFAKMGIHIISWLIVAISCIVFCGLVFWALWRKTDEFKYIVSIAKRIVKKKNKKENC
ncbi:MAG: oligosaccharide flippase family protein [Lachnospiraceae bacterium]|nr:oligosaccharide flippase family protein [Lachnospiraceae bacterium]